MQRAIITGATGVIGTALIQELIQNDIEVLVFCREGSVRNDRIPEHPLVEKCYCNLKQLSEIQNKSGKIYDVFYHLAWAGTTGQARNDMYLQEQNIRYALDAVGVAKSFGCHTFIGIGSQAEYGRVEGILRPDTPTFPDNGYGFAKLTSGLMTREYANQLGMKHIWVRILSIYGPNDGMQSMVMSVIRSALEGEQPKCTRGEQKWDYLYSKDAAYALKCLGDNGKDRKIYVLGSGKVTRLSDYIIKICENVNKKIKPNLGAIPYAPKQVMYLEADTANLKEDINFVPRYSFEKGIKETIQWVKETLQDEKN